MVGRKLQLSDLPEPILLYILSKLSERKEVVRTSLLSTQWRYLWKSVPVALHFDVYDSSGKKTVADMVASISRELYYWRSCQNIREFRALFPGYEKPFAEDVDLWVHFAALVSNVEKFALLLLSLPNEPSYKFPQFAYKNTSWKKLDLSCCELNPSGTVNWTSLICLSIANVNLTDGHMEKVLSGCPNLECLEICLCVGIIHLEISSVKLRKLTLINGLDKKDTLWIEIFAPYLLNLGLRGSCNEIQLRNVDSLVTADLRFSSPFDDGQVNFEKQVICFKEILRGIAHVKNLELCHWCIQCLPVLESKGWQFPPSSWKFLKLYAVLEQLDFPGICRFLRSSSVHETLVIECIPKNQLSGKTKEDEQSRRFETHDLSCALLRLKTINIIYYYFQGSSSRNKCVLSLAKHLLKKAAVLERFMISAIFIGREVSQDYIKMEEELLSFPRSSAHVSIVFNSFSC